MIRSTTYFVDFTFPARPVLSMDSHGTDPIRLQPGIYIQPSEKCSLSIRGAELMSMIANMPVLGRYQQYVGILLADKPRHQQSLAAMLHKLSTEVLGVVIQEIEQLDDRDRVFAITFFYQEG
jgi:hypothetical protein